MSQDKKRQYLVFRQERSRFALSLVSVREVLRLNDQPITPLPNTVSFVLGLTNLRGEILAIADFGRLIGAEAVDRLHENSRILILEIPNPDDIKQSVLRMGLAVSEVEGVWQIPSEQIRSASEVDEELIPFLRGLYDDQGHLLMIVDVEAIAHSERWS